MKKKSLFLVTVSVLSIFMSLNSFANQWVQFGQNWAYYQNDGTFAKNQWVGNYYLGGGWHYAYKRNNTRWGLCWS